MLAKKVPSGRVLTTGFSSLPTELYDPKAFITHAAWLGQACAHCPIFPTAAPVGVWAVSQSQCGWSSSQTSYPSRPWWAITPPTS